MILPEAEINFVIGARCRLLALPVQRGEKGEVLPCTLEQGRPFSLQTRHGVKGVKATVTKVIAFNPGEPHPPFICPDRTRLHGAAKAWLVTFELGNHTGFFSKHQERYMKAKGVGLTTDPRRGAFGEPAVVPDEVQQQYAEDGWANHQSDFADRCARAIDAVGTLRLEAARQNVGSPLARKHLKSAEHHLRAIQGEQRRSA